MCNMRTINQKPSYQSSSYTKSPWPEHDQHPFHHHMHNAWAQSIETLYRIPPFYLKNLFRFDAPAPSAPPAFLPPSLLRSLLFAAKSSSAERCSYGGRQCFSLAPHALKVFRVDTTIPSKPFEAWRTHRLQKMERGCRHV